MADRAAAAFDRDLEALSGSLDGAAAAASSLSDRLIYGGLELGYEDARSLVTRLERLSDQTEEFRVALANLERRARYEMDRLRVRARFQPEIVATTLAQLRDRAARAPAIARRHWLSELAAALRERELTAAETLLREPVAPPDGLQQARTSLARDLDDWRNGDVAAGRAMTDRLVALCADDLRVRRSARIARDLLLVRARLALDADEADRAAELLREGLLVTSDDALLMAELAGGYLAAGDRDAAYEAASRAVELAPDRADGYLHLGTVLEAQGGGLEEAVDLYRQGCLLLNVASLEYLGRGSTLLRLTGLLHRERARRLEELEYPRLALGALDRALSIGSVGTARYPNAPVHEARTRILQRLRRSDREIATEALTAGKQLLWNGDASAAVPLLLKACDLDPVPEAGWFLADAMLAVSWPDGELRPNREATEAAEQQWRSWLETVGPPDKSCAWAYATGAILAEQRLFWEDGPPPLWTALLRIEKGLVLDRFSALSWALSARYLRRLHLQALAAESADRSYELDPDDVDCVAQKLETLALADRYSDGLALLDRVSEVESDPWLLGMRGRLRFLGGDPQGALVDVSRALDGNGDDELYLSLRCSILVTLGRLDEAVADLRRVADSGPGNGLAGRLLRARALVVLGRPLDAAAELDAAAGDPLMPKAELSLTKTLVLVASGDLDAARRQAAGVRKEVSSRHDAEEITGLWRESVALLEHQAQLSAEALAVLWSAARQPPPQPTGDLAPEDDLRRGLASLDANSPADAEVALVAIAGRRSAAAGEWADSIRRYDSLVDTAFEAETTVARKDVLGQDLARAVRAGAATEALSLHERLAELGESPYRSRELVEADALLAVGDVAGALETLRRALEDGADDVQRFSTYQRLGEVAARAGDGSLSVQALEAALRIASQGDNFLAVAQTEARLGFACSVQGNHDTATQNLVRALRDFERAGALDPPYTLAVELLGLVRDASVGPPVEALAHAYRDATSRVYPDASVYQSLAESIRTSGTRG